MRFHLVSLPHTNTTDAFSACAFTEKVRKFAIMMTSLDHEVILYGGEYNDAPVIEHVPCISEQERLASLNDAHYTQGSFDFSRPHWTLFNEKCIAAMASRIRPKDFICVIGGRANKAIADAFPGCMTVEFGIGYGGTFSQYRVWESYAWMHLCYGAARPHDPNGVNGIWFDEVIPGYFEIERFPFSKEKDDYFLYVGRLTERKGVHIAEEVCRHLGKKLIIAGAGEYIPTYGEHVGTVGPEERGKLMSRAKALFVPTIYIEPFGNVAVEAQGCGTPVITTPWGAMTETVIEGKTGFHCHTFKEFVDAAKHAGDLDPWVCRDHARDNYSLEPTSRKYDRYFKRLLTLWDKGWYAL